MKSILVLLAAAAVMPDLAQLKQMSARFAPVQLKYDESGLSAGDQIVMSVGVVSSSAATTSGSRTNASGGAGGFGAPPGGFGGAGFGGGR